MRCWPTTNRIFETVVNFASPTTTILHPFETVGLFCNNNATTTQQQRLKTLIFVETFCKSELSRVSMNLLFIYPRTPSKVPLPSGGPKMVYLPLKYILKTSNSETPSGSGFSALPQECPEPTLPEVKTSTFAETFIKNGF